MTWPPQTQEGPHPNRVGAFLLVVRLISDGHRGGR